MKTKFLIIVIALSVTGCVTEKKWWQYLESTSSPKCLNIVKHLTCKQFLSSGTSILQTMDYIIDDPESPPSWVIFSTVVREGILRDAEILRNVPECK